MKILLFLLLTTSLGALQPPMEVYFITSGTGYRVNPMGGVLESFHQGVDMVGPHHCPVLAAEDGIVVENWPSPGTPNPKGGVFSGHPIFGGYIVLSHGNGLFTRYGHLSTVSVHTNQRVTAGQPIGYQGSTGKCTGEHLHFEAIQDPTTLFQTLKESK